MTTGWQDTPKGPKGHLALRNMRMQLSYGRWDRSLLAAAFGFVVGAICFPS